MYGMHAACAEGGALGAPSVSCSHHRSNQRSSLPLRSYSLSLQHTTPWCTLKGVQVRAVGSEGHLRAGGRTAGVNTSIITRCS